MLEPKSSLDTLVSLWFSAKPKIGLSCVGLAVNGNLSMIPKICSLSHDSYSILAQYVAAMILHPVSGLCKENPNTVLCKEARFQLIYLQIYHTDWLQTFSDGGFGIVFKLVFSFCLNLKKTETHRKSTGAGSLVPSSNVKPKNSSPENLHK